MGMVYSFLHIDGRCRTVAKLIGRLFRLLGSTVMIDKLLLILHLVDRDLIGANPGLADGLAA